MDVESRARRAQARREAAYPAECVPAGTPKPALYAGLSALERLARMTALCEAAYLASGRSIVTCPRDEMPGEIFRIE